MNKALIQIDKALNQPVSLSTIETVLLQGDLSKLTSQQRVSFYNKVCESIGVNPLTKPFDYIKLNGREVLYAKRDATDQLRKIHNVSIKITSREIVEGIYIVTAQARMPDGREDEATGAVSIEGLKGDARANALLKCESKAKRRVTLSICGLGFLDETELETIPELKGQPAEYLEHSHALPHSEREEPTRQQLEEGIPVCCNNEPMMISIFDNGLWYCKKCKKKRMRG